MKYLALDIGGTKIKYGIVDELGNVENSNSTDTEAYKGADYIIQKIKKIIENLIKEYDNIKGIGISTAGQVNSEEGEIIFATETFPGWTGVKLRRIIEETFNYPCYVNNDVNCAALGEMWVGAAKNQRNFLCLTLGTGIGGAIVINGNLFTGNNYIAGEFGHITLYGNGEKCSCGHRGCYEQYASTLALVRRAEKEINYKEKLNGKIIFDRANENVEPYKTVVDNWCEDVSLGLKNLIHIFNPPLIVIGGGVCEQGDNLIYKIENKLKTMVMPSFLKDLKISTAKCTNFAGMLGAVYGLKEKLNED